MNNLTYTLIIGIGATAVLDVFNPQPVKENKMRIPARFAPVLFSALLSAIMVAIVSAFVIAVSKGIHPQFMNDWFKSCITTWPVAFPTVAVVAPLVRQLVGRVTA